MAKKIGVFCPTLNVYGGGEYVAVAIANTLAQNNCEVILFSSNQIDPKAIKNFFGESLNPSIKTVKQPTYFGSRGLLDFYQNLIYAYIAKTKCDTFIDAYSNCVFPWTDAAYIHFPLLNKYVYRKKFPYFFSHHIVDAGILPQVMLEKKAVNFNGKLVLANSRYTAAEIKEYSGKTAQVLYPPFSPSIKAPTNSAKENLVVTTSRLDRNKKLERIPQIAAQTSKDTKFALVGRLLNREVLAEIKYSIKKLDLTDRVKIYPDLPAVQKLELLANSKVYLHTMPGEHFGISIVEAMALGCTPIVPNSGGMTEFVQSENRYETVEEAAGKINNAIDGWSPAWAEESMAIADQFSYANFAQRFMELFNQYCN
jgi:glycosyltransferase involved in cell wall biosynthesis